MKQRILIFKPGIDHNGNIIETAKINNPVVPVYIDFDRSIPPIGAAALDIDADGNVNALFNVNCDSLSGMFPALGGQYLSENILLITEASVCNGPNTDPRIKPFN